MPSGWNMSSLPCRRGFPLVARLPASAPAGVASTSMNPRPTTVRSRRRLPSYASAVPGRADATVRARNVNLSLRTGRFAGDPPAAPSLQATAAVIAARRTDKERWPGEWVFPGTRCNSRLGFEVLNTSFCSGADP